jgi:hypothetical protein
MLILEIAAGIVLGFLILAFWAEALVLAFGLVLIAAALAVLAILTGQWQPIANATEDLRGVVIVVFFAVIAVWFGAVLRRLFRVWSECFHARRARVRPRGAAS